MEGIHLDLTANFDELTRRAFGLARRIVEHHHDAEDIAQQAMLVVVQRADAFPSGDAWPWLSRVVRHLCIREVAKRLRRRNEALERPEALIEEGVSPAERAEKSDLLQCLRRELARLPERERNALHLRYYSVTTYRDASRRYQIPLNTLASRVRKGEDQLRERMNRRGVAWSLGPLALWLGNALASASQWLKAQFAKLSPLTAPSAALGLALIVSIIAITEGSGGRLADSKAPAEQPETLELFAKRTMASVESGESLNHLGGRRAKYSTVFTTQLTDRAGDQVREELPDAQSDASSFTEVRVLRASIKNGKLVAQDEVIGDACIASVRADGLGQQIPLALWTVGESGSAWVPAKSEVDESILVAGARDFVGIMSPRADGYVELFPDHRELGQVDPKTHEALLVKEAKLRVAASAQIAAIDVVSSFTGLTTHLNLNEQTGYEAFRLLEGESIRILLTNQRGELKDYELVLKAGWNTWSPDSNRTSQQSGTKPGRNLDDAREVGVSRRALSTPSFELLVSVAEPMRLEGRLGVKVEAARGEGNPIAPGESIELRIQTDTTLALPSTTLRFAARLVPKGSGLEVRVFRDGSVLNLAHANLVWWPSNASAKGSENAAASDQGKRSNNHANESVAEEELETPLRERRENPVDGDGSVAPEVEEKPEIDLEDWLNGGDATPPTNSGPPFGQIPFGVVGTRMPSTPATLLISLTANAWLGNGMAPMGSILNPVVDDAAVITLDGNPASLADVPSGATCDCLMYRQGNVWIVFDILAWSGNGPYFPMPIGSGW